MMLSLLAGCQSPMDDSLYQQWSKSQSSPTVTGSIEQATADQTVVDKTLPTPATLGDLIVYAQAHNPSIQAANHRIEQARQGIPIATSLSDPMFTIAPVGQMAQTADGKVTMMSSLSQKFPLSDKLRVSGDVAGEQVKIATEQLRQTRLAVMRDVRKTYWGYQLATQTLKVLNEQRELMQQFNDAANAAYRAGRSAQQDLLRINVEISTLDNRITQATQQQQTMLARLNTLLDRSASAPLQIKLIDETPNTDLTEQHWQQQALEHSPQLEMIHIAIAQARKQLKLAHLKRIPDLTVMLNYAAVSDHGTSLAANGTDQIYAGLGINLPIWQDKLDAAEHQAVARIRELLSQLLALRNQLQYDVADMVSRVQSQQKQDTLYHGTILPQAQQAVEASLSSYRAGHSSFVNLIDNWRKMLDLQIMTLKNHTLWQQNLAQLQFLAAGETAP